MPSALRGGAVAIGNFDGVHLGHAKIIERCVAKARELGGPALIFTFDPHPVRLLRPEIAPPPLTWTERKAELVTALGVDTMIAYPTDLALLQLEPRDFFEKIVLEKLAARAMVEGPNFFFGHNRAGTIKMLGELTREAGIDLEVVAPVVVDDEIVSSSRVRRLLAAGQIANVRRMLTQPYRVRGMVTHGAGRGTTIGFPTANLEAIDTLLPAEAVYAGRGSDAKQTWPAAINIGTNPTFGEAARKVEVHLIGCDRALYGEPLEVDFLQRLRDIQPFASVDDLKQQLTRDVAETQRIVENYESHH